jgi:hypothetical protein
VATRLTDQAAVAVAVARAAAPHEPSIGHLLIGLATEPEGRAGRRLRERATAVALLTERAGQCPAPPLTAALTQAAAQAGLRAVSTVDLLDAAVRAGGEDVADLLEQVGFHRDLDGWLLGAVEHTWFDAAETLGWSPAGDDTLDPVASRVAAQVRAVGGGAVDVLIAAAAAPELGEDLDPETLAGAAGRLRPTATWDAGLDTVVDTAVLLTDSPPATLRDLLRAALIAGGDGPRQVLQAAEHAA